MAGNHQCHLRQHDVEGTMEEVVVTVVEGYERESVAVFIDGDYLYGSDPHEIELFDFLKQLQKRRGMLVDVRLEHASTYGRAYEYFDDLRTNRND